MQGMESNGDMTMGESPRSFSASGKSGLGREESAPAKPSNGMQKLLEQVSRGNCTHYRSLK